MKQAGAELCKAQDQLDLPAEAELLLSVLRNILLIPSYLSHLPFRLSAMEVVFRLFKISKFVLRFIGVDLQMLQSKFSLLPAI